MVTIGYRPILWHLMKYYAHFGHKDFILCLGYRRDVIKHYFLDYDEALSNDFILAEGGRKIELLNTRHPGLAHHLRRHRADDEHRPAAAPGREPTSRATRSSSPTTPTASPTSTSTAYIERFRESKRIAAMVSVMPNASYHFVATSDGTGHRRSTDVARGATFASTADSSSFAARSSTTCARVKIWSTHRSHAPDRRAAAHGATTTTASGRRWTPSRTSSSSTSCSPAANRRGKIGRNVEAAHATADPWAAAARAHWCCSASAPTADDLEIGCSGTLLRLIAERRRRRRSLGRLQRRRAAGARSPRAARAACCAAPRRSTWKCAGFRDGFFPFDGAAIKEWFEQFKRRVDPDLILTHRGDDAPSGPSDGRRS